MRRITAFILALSCLLTLSGCSGGKKEVSAPQATLAPAAVPYDAPDGDSFEGNNRSYRLYLPGQNGLQLVTRDMVLQTGSTNDTARKLVEALLSFEGDEEARSPGGGRQLSLYGENPIEISGGICTVNISSSALQLSYRDYYEACVAVATTLCELDEISFVNFLVADQSVGLDITGSLAMGSLTAHPDENLPVLWEQMEAKRTPLGDDIGRTSMSALATLYTPLDEGRGMTCENRILNFEGQTPQQMASALLSAMTEADRSGAMEVLNTSLTHEPVISELEDGGRLITLTLRRDTADRLEDLDLDLACLLGAVTYTLTTFIPGIAAVCVRVEDTPVTELQSRRFGNITVLGGLLKRSMFGDFLKEHMTAWFVSGGRLVRTDTSVDRLDAESPRAQLESLIDGPGKRLRDDGIEASMPGNVRDDDILGIAEMDEILLINLSESFRSEIQAAGSEQERLICYSIVNTLCENTGKRKVCFFFEGEQVETIAGDIYWAGTFLYNPGLGEN